MLERTPEVLPGTKLLKQSLGVSIGILLWLGVASAQDALPDSQPTGQAEVSPIPPTPLKLDLDQALAESRRSGMRLALFFRMDDSPWALAMEKKVLNDSKVLEAIKGSPLVEVDSNLNPQQAERFGVVDFPTLLILNPEGREVVRIRGFATPAQLLEAFSPPATAVPLAEPAGNTVESLFQQIVWNRERGQLRDAADSARKLIELDSENTAGHTDNAMAFLGLLAVRQGRWEEAHSFYSRINQRYPTTELRGHALQGQGFSAAQSGQTQDAIDAYELFLKESPKHPDAAFVRNEVQALKRRGREDG